MILPWFYRDDHTGILMDTYLEIDRNRTSSMMENGWQMAGKWLENGWKWMEHGWKMDGNGWEPTLW